ncbi:DUF1361 domain-containing protein, partial [Candidatus Peregrinibacteria bacterium]|nr:DUF1361 domain-containing protein [Candidatus Peregrinibacteria bacterium]
MNLIFGLNIHGYSILGIFWNLFLILIPCLTVYGMAVAVGKRPWKALGGIERAVFVALFLYWLFWFPNTAYQFMIPRHLADYCAHFDKNRVCDTGSWLVTFFFVYALAGLPAFYYALNRMEGLLARVFSNRLSKGFTALAIPLTTLGVMLGLFERANSWEVLTAPWGLAKTTVGYLQNADTLLFFGLFTASLYAIYYGFR